MMTDWDENKKKPAEENNQKREEHNGSCRLVAFLLKRQILVAANWYSHKGVRLYIHATGNPSAVFCVLRETDRPAGVDVFVGADGVWGWLPREECLRLAEPAHQFDNPGRPPCKAFHRDLLIKDSDLTKLDKWCEEHRHG